MFTTWMLESDEKVAPSIVKGEEIKLFGVSVSKSITVSRGFKSDWLIKGEAKAHPSISTKKTTVLNANKTQILLILNSFSADGCER